MNQKINVIDKALQERRTILSEYESKELLRTYNIPITREILAENREAFTRAIGDIGYPLVIKGCAPHLSHKTEQGMVRIDVRTDGEAHAAYEEIMPRIQKEKGAILVQEMVKGTRELMVGMTRDAQFGPCVMFGLGGIFTEILKDISFRVAPVEKRDALEMMLEIKAHKILEPIRGMPAADLDQLSEILIQVGQIGLDHAPIKEIDINPIILSGRRPVAVDALVVLNSQ